MPLYVNHPCYSIITGHFTTFTSIFVYLFQFRFTNTIELQISYIYL